MHTHKLRSMDTLLYCFSPSFKNGFPFHYPFLLQYPVFSVHLPRLIWACPHGVQQFIYKRASSKERDSTLAYLDKWYVSLLTFFYCHRLTGVPKLVTTLMTIEISIVPSTIQQTPQYNLQLQENQAQGEEQLEYQPQQLILNHQQKN